MQFIQFQDLIKVWFHFEFWLHYQTTLKWKLITNSSLYYISSSEKKKTTWLFLLYLLCLTSVYFQLYCITPQIKLNKLGTGNKKSHVHPLKIIADITKKFRKNNVKLIQTKQFTCHFLLGKECLIAEKILFQVITYGLTAYFGH